MERCMEEENPKHKRRVKKRSKKGIVAFAMWQRPVKNESKDFLIQMPTQKLIPVKGYEGKIFVHENADMNDMAQKFRRSQTYY